MARKLTPLLRRVELALRDAFPDLRSGLERVPSTGRITGFVVSTKFRGLDHSERRDRLLGALSTGFTKDDLSLIGPIITMTPAEADVGETAA